MTNLILGGVVCWALAFLVVCQEAYVYQRDGQPVLRSLQWVLMANVLGWAGIICWGRAAWLVI